MRTINDYLQIAVQNNPQKIFLYQGNRELTFEEFDKLTNQLADSFLHLGLRRGDHLGLLALNQIEWLLTFFAATKIGVGIVALSPRYRDSELKYMLNHSEAKAVISIGNFVDYSFVNALKKLQSELKTVENYIFIEEGFSGSLSFQELLTKPLKKERLEISKDKVEPNDLSVMIYTSGTTGKPKGVMITHHSILSSAQAQVNHFQVTEKDIAIGSLPFNHVGGITCTIMVALLSQSSVALIPLFDPKRVLTAIEVYGATIFGGVPTMYLMLFAQENITNVDLNTLRLAIAGGSNVDPDVYKKVTQIIPNVSVVNLYGLSESSGACILSNITDPIEKVQSTLGVPIGDFEVKIVNEKREKISKGEIGELAIKGDCVAKGYYHDEKREKETFTDDGWLYTGDIVVQDEDNYIAFKGRAKEMFVQGGFNIYPIEVENLLTTHKKVQFAAGIGIPDKFLGEIGRYYIVPVKGEQVSEEELITFCKAHLADYKVPRQIGLVDELPMTPAGKIHKAKLKNDYLQAK